MKLDLLASSLDIWGRFQHPLKNQTLAADKSFEMEAPTILVVDDTLTNLKFVQGVLDAEGFRTLGAEDGPTARALCLQEHPDLILLDVVMPGETGFETCARLKSLKWKARPRARSPSLT